MKKFEYKVINYDGTCWDSKNTIKSLNDLGKEGWELIFYHESSSFSYAFVGLFKREIVK